MENKRKNIKKHEIITLLVTLAIIVLVNIIGSAVFTRVDLTTDKRYTLSDKSKEILSNLDDNVYFEVYLDGDFSADFKRLRKEIKEMLDEFHAYNKFVDYTFINPSESDDQAERYDTYKILREKGLVNYMDEIQTHSGAEYVIIWPGVIINYQGKEKAIDLLEDQKGLDKSTVLNNVAENLEFTLIRAINDITRNSSHTIAFTTGHGELNDWEIYDIEKSLSKRYLVNFNDSLQKRKRPVISGNFRSLLKPMINPDSSIVFRPAYDAIVIAKPTEPFTNNEKLILDQYIMSGGKVMWLIDPVSASMDSLSFSESTWGLAQDLNLDDQLFKYGVKLNNNLLLSANCGKLKIWEQQGDDAQMKTYPWYYFPLLFPASEHPIVKGIDPVKTVFVSSLEPTTSSSDIKKTPLLSTLEYTAISRAPMEISLSILNDEKEVKNDIRSYFPQRDIVAAYLLSGTFTSLYENRIPKEYLESQEMSLKTQSVPTSMIVVADGDIVCNQFAMPDYAKANNVEIGTPLPLGYDQYSKEYYGNKQFIENAVMCLLEGEGLLDIKARNLKIRLLDTNKISGNTTKWQLINVVLPSVIMIVLGLVLAFVRKQKYN